MSETVSLPAAATSARYDVVRTLGAGGMGEVLLARQRMAGGLARTVVLKTMLPHIASSRANVELFLREARLAASLSHPNVVQIYDVTEHEGRPCIVMEYLRGADLSSVQRRAGRAGTWFTASEVVAILAQAADGLAHAHAHVGDDERPRSIVHRDVSPQNLLLSRDGSVKVLDFGIARAMDDPRTQTGVLRGKLAYMSPEQLDGGREVPVGPPSDQFALGVLLWECLTRKRLFHRGSPIETMRAVVEMPIPPPSALSGSPVIFDAIVLRALERDASARWPSCEALASALREAARSLSSATEPELVRALVQRLVPDAPAPAVSHESTGSHAKTEQTPEPTSLSQEIALEEEPEEDPEAADLAAHIPTYVPPDTAALGAIRRVAAPVVALPPPSEPARAGPSRTVLAAAGAVVVLVALAGLFAVRSFEAPTPVAVALAPTASPTAAPPPTAPRSITAQFVGVPEGATIEVDGLVVEGASFTAPASPTPHPTRILVLGEERWSADLVLEHDQTIRVALPTIPLSTAVPTTQPEVETPVSPARPAHAPTAHRRGTPRERIVRDYPTE